MRTLSTGQIVFAATMIAVGLFGSITGGSAGIWAPLPPSWPAREMLVHLSALVALATGAGLLWRRTAAPAAVSLLAYLTVWMVAIKGRAILEAPVSPVAWESLGETAVLVAAAWAVLVASAAGAPRRRAAFLAGGAGLRACRVLYALAMIAFGVAHFAYPGPTADLTPAWLPARLAWVYATGSAYVAAGLAMLAGPAARLAATLSAVQMGLFTLLVWGPVLAAGSADASQRSEAILSWALTAGGWAVADSYSRGRDGRRRP